MEQMANHFLKTLPIVVAEKMTQKPEAPEMISEIAGKKDSICTWEVMDNVQTIIQW